MKHFSKGNYLLILFIFLTPTGCSKFKKSNEGSTVSESGAAKGPTIRLKDGDKIILDEFFLKATPNLRLVKGQRVAQVYHGGDADGLAFLWSAPAWPVLIPQNTESELITGDAPAPTQSQGLITLPNLSQARQMTLPVFWPEGELFLSNSAGLWISDAAYQELKQQGRMTWSPGILGNAMLGPAEDFAPIPWGLAVLQQRLMTQPKLAQEEKQVQSNPKNKKFKLNVNGQAREVPIIEAKNWLGSYIILDDAQNPLVLQFKLLPEASLGEIIFSSAWILKPFLDYQVKEIQTQNAEAASL